MAVSYVEEETKKKKGLSFPKFFSKKEIQQDLVEADLDYLTEVMKSEIVEEEAFHVNQETEDKKEEIKETDEIPVENVPKQENVQSKKNQKLTPEEKEKKHLFEKTYTCPVCGKEFKEKLVRGKRAHLIRTERDLRPIHKGIDTGKYDVILCPDCGYAAMTRYFKIITETQITEIKETIVPKYKKLTVNKEIYTYGDALARYKMALATAIVKQAKLSEKAYICLKTAWVVRGMREEIGEETSENKVFLKECKNLENQYLKQAYRGFMAVIETESFPLCGMDEATFHYLMAALAYREKQYDIAKSMLKYVKKTSEITPHLQEKADILEELIIQKLEV